MTTLERFINIFVNNDKANQSLDDTSNKLKKVDGNSTKVTQSTKTMTQATTSHTDAVVKNGGAVAILNSLTGGMFNAFKDASEAISLAGISLTSFKGILLATGIGAAVLAVGYLAENWEKVAVALGFVDANAKEAEASIKSLREAFNSSKVAAVNIKVLTDAIDDQTLSLQERQKALDTLAATIPSLTNLKIGIDDKLITQAISSFTSLVEQSALLTKNNEALNLAYAAQVTIQDKIGEASKFKNRSAFQQDALDKALIEQKFNDDKIASLEKENRQISKNIIADNESLNLAKDAGAFRTAAAARKASEDAAEAARLEGLRKAEESRLEQLKRITDAITKSTKALGDEVNTTEIEKMAIALNGQYVELVGIYNLRTQLLDQQKAAQDLAKIGGESAEETAQLKLIQTQITKYDELIGIKTKSILQDSKLDADAAKRIEVIELNGAAELAIMNGNVFDGLGLQKQAFDIEREYREANLQNIVDINEKALKAAEDKLATELENTETYNKALAVRNDLEISLSKNKILLNEENTTNEQISNQINLDRYLEFSNRKKEIDENYYQALSITSSNLQGFMSQLQDEQLVKQREIRNILLLAEKGLAIAGVVVNTIKENAALSKVAIREGVLAGASFAAGDYRGAALHKVAATSALGGIGLNKINAGISIASIIGTTITSWNKGGGGGSAGGTGGGGGGPQAQFNIVGSSGNNQLAATIAAQQNQPVNAFVVGSNVSTQQALDRNRITTATFLSLLPFISLFLL